MSQQLAQMFTRVGQIGFGVALVGGVINSALYNGMVINWKLINIFYFQIPMAIKLLNTKIWSQLMNTYDSFLLLH